MAKKANQLITPTEGPLAPTTDQQVLTLIKEVTRRKQEIARIEKPQWRTNMLFAYVEDGVSNKGINLHAELAPGNLIKIAGFVIERETFYRQAASELGVETMPPFTWLGYTSEDWLEDLKMRIQKIQIVSKKKKLEALEERLNNIISPELRAKMEIDAIIADLD